ncbi:MAG: hypothetical protein D6722_07830 [Bacteroidetes bacterium]|nr:MAG: hypothetical protein D6722_07830 [Bacteroidota bacterium]
MPAWGAASALGRLIFVPLMLGAILCVCLGLLLVTELMSLQKLSARNAAARRRYARRERDHQALRQQFAAWRAAISEELRQLGHRPPSD